MTKKQQRPKESKLDFPVFNPGQTLAIAAPTIVADVNGIAWLLDPTLGTMSVVSVVLRGGKELRESLSRRQTAAQNADWMR